MYSLSSFVFLGSVVLETVFGLPSPSRVVSARDAAILKRSVDSFIAAESPIALQDMLCNIGSSGACAPGTASGLVLASPDSTNPNYFFTWTRDSALVFKCIVDTFINQYDASLQAKIEAYITAQAKLQTVSNPSGDLSNGLGLGEPHYNADGSPFTAAWGRPQRDGPALRATALINYSKWLINNGYTSTVTSLIWPIIQNDLSYVGQYWNQSTFDLWEEVDGSSFFTTNAQHRSLVEGSSLAKEIGKTCPMCDSQAPQILCFLQTFWNPSGNFMMANINENNGRSGKDANVILSSIQGFDSAAGCDATTFQPCSDKALASHKVVTDSFRSIYTLNSGKAEGTAVAVGRYPEDSYMGGNPWYLITMGASEQLYDALYTWNKQGFITVTSTSLAFFNDFASVAVGTYASSTSTYTTIFNAIQTYADGYVNVVATFAQVNGSLSEQFSRSNGQPLSAYDLTWSYAAFLTAAARRAGIVPFSWGESTASSVPSVCSGTSAIGTYSTAPTGAFPAGQTPVTGVVTTTAPGSPVTTPNSSTSTSTSCATATSVAVTFDEIVTTVFGQTIKIAGSVSQLGVWDTDNAITLSAINYTDSNHLWDGTISFQAGEVIQYKYINVASDGAVTWEADPNHTFTVPATCATAVTVSNSWQF